MIDNKWLGSKTKQGFYKKVNNDKGAPEIHGLDLNTLRYRPSGKVKFGTLESTKSIDKVIDRFKVLIKGKDKAGDFYRKNFASMFAYVQNRIPEISDELYRLDDAMKAGFGWEHGPFEIWDAVGIKEGMALMESEGHPVADWVKTLAASGQNFYAIKDNRKYYYDIPKKSMAQIPGQDAFIILDTVRPATTIWSNNEACIQHLGDGVLNVEFQSKMNTIGGGVLTSHQQGNRPGRKGVRRSNPWKSGCEFLCGSQSRHGLYAGHRTGIRRTEHGHKNVSGHGDAPEIFFCSNLDNPQRHDLWRSL